MHNISTEEAKLITKVLNEGMPTYQPQRDKLARLCVRLEDELEKDKKLGR